MIRYAAAFLVATGMALVGPAQAGEFNKKLSIGDSAPVFTGLEGVDGKTHSLADLKDKDVVVVCITCNHCPVAVAYEDRIIAFAKKYASGADSKVGMVAINVNKSEADGLPKMKERAKEKGFNFPYLFDPSQKIGRELGASVTPEFFVLNKERKVVYMGALDDNMRAPKVNYLDAAVTAALEGKKPAKTETRPSGCGVQYER
jgi:peroxiredoxin